MARHRCLRVLVSVHDGGGRSGRIAERLRRQRRVLYLPGPVESAVAPDIRVPQGPNVGRLSPNPTLQRRCDAKRQTDTSARSPSSRRSARETLTCTASRPVVGFLVQGSHARGLLGTAPRRTYRTPLLHLGVSLARRVRALSKSMRRVQRRNDRGHQGSCAHPSEQVPSRASDTPGGNQTQARHVVL